MGDFTLVNLQEATMPKLTKSLLAIAALGIAMPTSATETKELCLYARENIDGNIEYTIYQNEGGNNDFEGTSLAKAISFARNNCTNADYIINKLTSGNPPPEV